jgi:hypothetical protein
VPPGHGQPCVAQDARQFRQLDGPDRIGGGHPRPLLLGERPAFLDRESETPAWLQHARHLTHQGILVGEGQHRLQQEYHLEAALGQRREVSLLEAAGKIPGQLPGGGQCAGGVIDAQVVASRLRRDHPAGAGHPAAQVEHRDAVADPGLVSQPPDLGRPHEALLAYIPARGVGGRPGPLQRRQGWCSLILSQVRSRCCPERRVPPDTAGPPAVSRRARVERTPVVSGRTASTATTYYLVSGMTDRRRMWFRSAARGEAGSVRRALGRAGTACGST